MRSFDYVITFVGSISEKEQVLDSSPPPIQNLLYKS